MTGSQHSNKTLFTLVVVTLSLVAGVASASLNKGIVEFQQGSYEAAAETLTGVVAREPGDLTANYWLGRAQLAAGRSAMAEQPLRVVVEGMPTSVEARYWLGTALLRSGRVAEARAQFEAALKIDPKNELCAKALDELPETVLAPAAGRGEGVGSSNGAGSRISFDPGGLPIELGQVDLLSYNVADYTFSSAPTDWLARSGVWAITNRWTCSPQWSWLGGYAEDGIAALWNKREFSGDVTVETYMGFKMGLGSVNSYKNPTDLNISIHADGANPSSGYSFMVGASRNQETRIMKGTHVLASTSDPEALLPIFEDGYPSTYEFHRKWWAIRARQIGNRLELYLDGKLVLQAEDPEPLQRGRVALWTYDEGVIISRVKVYYAGEERTRRAIPGEEAIQAPLTEIADTPFAVSSRTHPSVQNDFEVSVGEWRPRDESAPVSMRIVGPGANGAGHGLAITNTVSGGTFGTRIVPGQFSVDSLPVMSFDYRLPADGNAKVNFYLTAAGRPYEIIFSGPRTGSPRATQVGEIGDVRADGTWHHAEFDLLGALQVALGKTGGIQARDLWLGNMCEDDYLLAGFGGNQLGTTFQLDSFVLDKPGGSAAKIAITPDRGTKLTGHSILVDDRPLSEPPPGVTHTSSSLDIELKSSGVSYVHVRSQREGGEWTAPVHYRVRVDDTAPTVAGLTPTAGSPLPDGPISIALEDEGGSGIDMLSIQLAMNGKRIPVDGEKVVYHPDAATIAVDPRLLIDKPVDGGQVRLSLEALKDRAGNAIEKPLHWAYRLAFADDKTAPLAPRIKVGEGAELIYADFEDSMGGFTTYGGSSGAELSLDDTTAASGRRSLRVYNPTEGGRFGIIRRGAFDAGKYRIVSFDYRVPARLRVDFAVYVNGDMKGIKFKDNDNNLGVIGSVPNVKADNEWHHAEINLYDMLRKDDPTAASYVVNQLVLADWNWKANVEGQSYHIDNFQIIPVVSGTGGLPLSWLSPDISGIAGLAWAITTSASPNVPESVKLTGNQGVIHSVGNTNGWLHTRVCDGAGNWSAPRSQRLIADSDAPTAVILAPTNGRRVAASAVKLKVRDGGVAGIDPSSIVLTVAGKDYTVKKRGVGGLSYDSSSQTLEWNCERVTPKPIVLPDKKPVSVALKSARDYAGNAVTSLPKMTWTMDYSLDKTPPRVAELKSNTHRTYLTNTFEDGLQGWKNYGGVAGAKVKLDRSTAASGKYSVKLTQQKRSGRMSAYVTTEPFAAENYPIVSFDYKVPSGVKLDLVIHMANGNEYAIAFTDNPTGAIGRIARVRADNKWRHASVEISSALRKKVRQGTLKVAYMYFADRNNLENKVNATAWFDNFTIGAVGTRTPVLRWKATDTTGVVGYSYALDRDPGTVPDTVSEGASQSFRHPTKLTKGRWYFHVRALDGAHNWGPATHYALMHLSPD